MGNSATTSAARHRWEGQRGQSLPAILGLSLVVVILALAGVAILGSVTAKGRAQRAADLAALSAARSMRDDYQRLFIPRTRLDGGIDPRHLSRSEYLGRAEGAAREAAARNGAGRNGSGVEIRFPDGDSIGPRQVEVELRARIELPEGGERESVGTEVAAIAEIAPTAPTPYGAAGPAIASGGGYSGPLAYRQGKPMRPDVAAGFDRMATAARGAGHGLVVNSGFRSDAEQAALFAANPDPRMVARPGTSLHRCGTELDIGPPSAYAWLAVNAGRFGFLQRYSWEAWHYGFTAGPDPCSAEGDRGGGSQRNAGGGGAGRDGDGGSASGGGLPGYVPSQFRGPLLDSASRHDVPAELLAAQLMAESNFNPGAVSPVGASGIAQFMPATAAAYGLRDPFDPVASIDAQARMMSELLGRFGSVELALAAYNAGPGAVGSCGCIPPYAETRNYVAKITGLIGGSGALGASFAPSFEVELIE